MCGPQFPLNHNLDLTNMMHTPAHKYVPREESQAQAQDNPKADQMADFDLDDDTPLAQPACTLDGEACESCQ